MILQMLFNIYIDMSKKLNLITSALMLMLSAVSLITAYISNNPTALGVAVVLSVYSVSGTAYLLLNE